MKKIFGSILVIVLTLLSCNSSSQKEITIIQDPAKEQDAIISSLENNKNFSTEENNHLYAAINGENTNITRVLINFKEIPRNVAIDSAYLSLKFNTTSIYGKQHYGINQFVVSRIVSPWDKEDVTWNNKPVVSEFNKVYQDNVALNNDPNRINLTKLVQEISDDYENSYGFELSLLNETQNSLLLLASSNHPNKDLRPKLQIYYKEKN
ncbi:DNRLRE domain-containing protein [Flavobacterium sp.]|jgi:hypothetical protein|uniref:DNRLRE domain-containing protein n=1 Tax=Flavobacterium sp. TaxID=239 RepID=UPI0037BFDB48